MTDLPEISGEMVDAFNRASGKVWKERAPKTQGDAVAVDREATRAGLAAALVASGWRPEADVRREVQRSLSLAGLAALRCIPDGRIQNGCVIHDGAQVRERFRQAYLAITAEPATALEQAQPLPVADGSPFGAVVHEQTGLKGTSKDGQERGEADVLAAAIADARSWLRRNPPPRNNGARSERRG